MFQTSNVNRKELIEAVFQASRESSTTAVFFHTAIAERVGLGPTEEKTLFILASHGPLTAGEIAQQTGLTTPSVTNLIDRLEKKGFVRRIHDSKDRRRVIVEPDEERLAELGRLFSSWQDSFGELLNNYTDEQLAAIADFLTRAAQYSRQTVATWNQGKESKDDNKENS
jgi:DNA-binding MarR family transcriptional regulator